MKCILQQSVTEGLQGICQPLYPYATDQGDPTVPRAYQVLTLIKYS